MLQIRQWYEDRSAGLGHDFAEEIDARIVRIVESPLVFPRVSGDTRRAVLHRFPYAIYFRLLDDAVIVLAVHGRQHPRRWQRRK